MTGKMTNQTELKEITVESTRIASNGSYIDDDLALVDDIARLPFPQEPRRVRALILALCTSGSMEYSVDTIKHTVFAGDIIIINSGQVTDDYHKSPDCTGIALVISDQFFYEVLSGVHEISYLFTFSRTHPVFHLTEEEMQNTSNYFHLIKRKVDDTGHRFRRDTVRSLIQALIYDTGDTISRIQATSQTLGTRAEHIYIEFMRLVEQEFYHERRVGWYARQLSITAKYLSETVKQVSHQTPNEWIDYYVVLELRTLLRSTTKSIKEITEMMHFPNQSFLGKYFKEHVGVSPSVFRKKPLKTFSA